MFEDYKDRESVVIVFTGDGKGKTLASLGLAMRALGYGWSVAYIQFIKHWSVSEHKFIKSLNKLYGDKIYFFKGGKGFYKAGQLSAKNVTAKQHKEAALETYKEALNASQSGKYNLVVCDEINNSVHDGLVTETQITELITKRNTETSICLTGRHYPKKLLKYADIATDMTKLKHHFDNKYLAKAGIDY